MTYYDEFNLTPAAPAEEIRKAHRSLSRILHPDHQTDETLRRLSEIHMRRVNEIYATLSDPARRRRYDESIETRPPGPERTFTSKKPFRAWAAAAGCAGVAVLWLAPASPRGGCPAPPIPAGPALPASAATASRGASQAASRPPRAPNAPPHRVSPIPAPSLPPREVRKAPGPMRTALAAAPARLDDTPQQPVAPVAPLVAFPADTATPPALVAAAELARNIPARSLAGTWYYPRPPVQEPSALYPPEFIELVIGEADGALHGRYRARYRVTNRALSPEVAFRFDGPASENEAGYDWRSPGGGRGEVRLTLNREGKLEVAWSASVLGELGLSSGTAVLARKR